MRFKDIFLIGTIALNACTGDPSPKQIVIHTTKHNISATLDSTSTDNHTQEGYQSDTVLVYPQTEFNVDQDTLSDTGQQKYKGDSSRVENTEREQLILSSLTSQKNNSLTSGSSTSDNIFPPNTQYDTVLIGRIQKGVESSISMKAYHKGIIELLKKTHMIKNIHGKMYISFVLPSDKKDIRALLKKCDLSTLGLSVLSNETLSNIITSIGMHITANDYFFIDENEIENLKHWFIALK